MLITSDNPETVTKIKEFSERTRKELALMKDACAHETEVEKKTEETE